jgi:hypothetical protein
MQEVLDSAKNVVEVSSYVHINREAIADFSKRMLEERIEVPQWNRRYHFGGDGQDTVSYLLVLDSLNFCFWPGPDRAKWEIEYESERLSGYYALAASLKQAIESRIPITRAEYLAGLSLDSLKGILGGRGELQLLERRVQILNELGHFLMREYNGEAHRLIDAAGSSAEKLVRLIVKNVTSFQDVAEYLGQKVYFYKRAQIFCTDLHGAFNGTQWGSFKDVDSLTAFADYKLPQVLRYLGVLHYDETLARKVDRKVLLESGSPEEIEIRANTIWAVEKIRRGLEQMGKALRAFEIDWILWNMGQKRSFKARPHHRTVTIFY